MVTDAVDKIYHYDAPCALHRIEVRQCGHSVVTDAVDKIYHYDVPCALHRIEVRQCGHRCC